MGQVQGNVNSFAPVAEKATELYFVYKILALLVTLGIFAAIITFVYKLEADAKKAIPTDKVNDTSMYHTVTNMVDQAVHAQEQRTKYPNRNATTTPPGAH